MEERLQKILSKCGIASRRKAEEMILEGRVTINGKVAVIGIKADIERDHIKVDGKLLRKTEPKVYLMFNKPAGVVTSLSDPEGRPTVNDFLKGIKHRVFPVGRLDYDSEGLLFLPNDGEFAHSILHPSREIPKTYLVKIDGFLEDKDIQKLEKGVRLKETVTAPARVRKVKKMEANSWIEITIHEGKKRQIRRMLEIVGHSVIKLIRVKINGVELGKLQSGKYSYLTPEEINRLNHFHS